MTELKTLKDFECINGMIYLREIKDEAIKWVKEMDINKSEDYCNGMMDFIMNFFNITQADLK